ncbi:hypothetical protein DWX43_14850 [Clostridium sp. AF19-22AC]|jgi:superfamily II DNA or RNA helicase|uniref:DEAD/DEAH box helicase family protein n=1 Tax=Clostridia TaxID=186801 RepID=UPI000E5542CE|nr:MULTISPECIES: DEAD/DEAH box helicase family protein [Clostridia]RHR27110.1 hypothetical protein DWX43_14850 [Clostridium sp. AF19-22AC]
MSESTEKKYISDEIGEEYQNWREGNIIFITAPTGSGKTHFVLYKYLKWAIEKNFKILYLVNRRILQKQLRRELNEEVSRQLRDVYRQTGKALKEYINIETYQYIEKKIKNGDIGKLDSAMDKFSCVVCDECHYFYSDSNFNTATELSYLYIRKLFENKIRIYISATSEKILENIADYINGKRLVNPSFSDFYARCGEHIIKYGHGGEHCDLDIIVVNGTEDLVGKIKENINETKEKWLVFVDSISEGKILQRELLDNKDVSIAKKDVIFLDADYEYDENKHESVREIVEKKHSSKKVVISTAVMDNGVTFQDTDLVNIAVFADTEETFIQMLGRKRRANEKITLYILRRNSEHFRKRFQNVNNILKCYDKYEKELKLLYKPYICGNNVQTADNNNDNMHYIDAVHYPNIQFHRECQKYQQIILNAVLSHDFLEQHFYRFSYALNGIVTMNELAISRCDDLEKYYKDMADQLEKDENAFLKQQLRWLGKSGIDIASTIKEADKTVYEKHREELERAIQEIIGTELTKRQNIEFKLRLKDQFCYFVKYKSDEDEKDRNIKYLGQNDRPLSTKLFNSCVEYAKLGYEMTMQRLKGSDDSSEGKILYKIVEKIKE